ncbi:hypothetical protein GH714_001961 [Hevea brasiliensis]|uniref:RanBD1 domain-containing protein n=1 Tax=Hevea brasiliensis TaxID=3981 RepID=A0A6A6L9J9_HEVBR|nr:hypothetical protein GH714_001961 [Hevea brasiliensis]
MKGAKRFVVSDSAPDTNDTALRNKRIMAGSSFDVRRAEPSQQQSTAMPPLDVHRAESSRQHVRALNTQFASWVQAQLKNHPDEIWEDGVRDYLAHASNIMEKFSDVVKWLKTNTVKGGTAAESLALVYSPAIKVLEEYSLVAKALVCSAVIKTLVYSPRVQALDSIVLDYSPTVSSALSSANQSTGLFSTSQGSAGSFTNQSSGLFSNSQSSGLSSGSQNLASTNNNTSDDVDDENEPEQPSSPSVKKSEEKGIVVVHEVKCKLYVKSSDPADKDTWKDKGTGQLSIKCKEDVGKGTKESKPTIVVRNDVGRVLLNALLYPGIKTNAQKNSLVAIFHTAGDDGGNSENVVARTFLIRTKTEEDRNKLATAIQEYAPAS